MAPLYLFWGLFRFTIERWEIAVKKSAGGDGPGPWWALTATAEARAIQNKTLIANPAISTTIAHAKSHPIAIATLLVSSRSHDGARAVYAAAFTSGNCCDLPINHFRWLTPTVGHPTIPNSTRWGIGPVTFVTPLSRRAWLASQVGSLKFDPVRMWASSHTQRGRRARSK